MNVVHLPWIEAIEKKTVYVAYLQSQPRENPRKKINLMLLKIQKSKMKSLWRTKRPCLIKERKLNWKSNCINNSKPKNKESQTKFQNHKTTIKCIAYTKHENLKITLHRNHKATMTQLTIQTPLSSTKI